MSQKTIDDYFRDWEGEAIGYGYGSGEQHTLAALQKFLSLCEPKEYGSYDYQVIEQALGGAVTWFLISILCKEDILSYGTSARFGFLTKEGYRLREYVCSKTVDELYENIMRDSFVDDDCPIICYKNACNCGPHGYLKGVLCSNPFWPKRVP